MNAIAARLLTESSLPNPSAKVWLDAIYARVAATAAKGKSFISGPFKDMPWPSHEEQQAVWKALRAKGYRLDFHPDAELDDPEHDRYTLIAW